MILWLHIGGGVVTMVAVAAAIVAILRNINLSWVRYSLPAMATWQAVTGALLVVSGGSLLRVCGMGIGYLTVTGLVYTWARRHQRSYVTINV